MGICCPKMMAQEQSKEEERREEGKGAPVCVHDQE